MRVSISPEHDAAIRAAVTVYGLFIYYISMGVPPFQAAGVRTKFLFSRTGRLCKFFAAVFARESLASLMPPVE